MRVTITLYFFLATVATNCILALHADGIVGGYLAKRRALKYQVSIQGKLNFSVLHFSVCSGGIIANNLVISVAHCFLDEFGHLQNISYSVIADATDLLDLNTIQIEVDTLYLHRYKRSNTLNDIAVLKLIRSFGLNTNTQLSKLLLPKENKPLRDEIGTVSGYGFTWVKIRFDYRRKIPYRSSGGSDSKLRYAPVKIIDDYLCLTDERYRVNINYQFCGLMIPKFNGSRMGLCTGDSGSPLVINNTIIGLASRSIAECDDTIIGCVYTRVSAYVDFIQSIILNSPTNYTILYKNRQHVFKSN